MLYIGKYRSYAILNCVIVVTQQHSQALWLYLSSLPFTDFLFVLFCSNLSPYRLIPNLLNSRPVDDTGSHYTLFCQKRNNFSEIPLNHSISFMFHCPKFCHLSISKLIHSRRNELQTFIRLVKAQLSGMRRKLLPYYVGGGEK